MAALGAPRRDRAAAARTDRPARRTRVDELSRRRTAATTASTATCCARSPRPTAAGARRPGAAIVERDRRTGWRSTPRRARAALARARAGRVHRHGRAAQGRQRASCKADPDYERHAERLARGDRASCCAIQSGAAAGRATWPRGCAPARPSPPLMPRAKRAAGRGRFRRSDRLDARAARRSRAWATGCASSSTGGPTISWSTRRRTPTPTNGRSSTRWPSEFFAGSSEAERRHRTLFMVGDFKQAIFGFQGTDPREFEAMRALVPRRAPTALARGEPSDDRSAALEFRDLSIDASFRSAPAVLDVVDAVIAEVGHDALGLPEPPNAARAHSSPTGPGAVELWPPFAVDDARRGRRGRGRLDRRDATARYRRRSSPSEVAALARRGAGAGHRPGARCRRATS